MDALEAAINSSVQRCQGGHVEPQLDFKTNLDFQPFNKTSERSNSYLISDWTVRTRGRQQQQSGIAGGFAFKNDEELTAFNLESKQQKRTFLKPTSQKALPGQRLGRKVTTARPQTRRPLPNQNSKYPNQQRRFNFRRDEPARAYSCQIPPSWENIARLALQTPSGTVLPHASTLKTVGVVESIDPNLAPRQIRPLQASEQRSSVEIAIENDPYIAEILADAENLGEEGTFVMTAQVASLLMSTHRTIQPWDLHVTVQPNNITFITTGANPNNIVNQHLVDETTLDRLPTEIDNINSVISLAQEATVTQNTARNMLISRGTNPSNIGQQFPFAPETNGAATVTAYTYRSFTLENRVVIVRAPIHAHSPNKPDQLVHLASIFEFDSSFGGYHVDWRKNINTLYAAVFSNELKTNSAYMHRVVSEAILAGADDIQLMWVSRQSLKNTQNHQLLAVTLHSVSSYTQLVQSRKVDYFDGLYSILDELDLEAGSYTLLREPNERSLSIYEHKAATEQVEEHA